MATVFYYDASGVKKQTDSSQLQTLVKFGVIKPDSIIENANGVRVKASRINGLIFNESNQRAGADASSTSSVTSAVPPTASAVPPTGSIPSSPPSFGASHSAGSSPFSSAFQTNQNSSRTPTGDPSANASAFSGAQTGETKHCMACGALLTGAGRFCPRCGAPASGGAVSYCPACGAQIYAGQAVCTNCGRNANPSGLGDFGGPGVKNKTTAGILALLLGGIGIHKFYLGSWGWGIVYIVACLTGIPALVALIEGIVYLTMSEYDFQSKYSPATQSAFRW